MPSTPSPKPDDDNVVAAEPQLIVADLAASIAFYTGKLGFDVVFAYGEPPFYAQVARGGGRLNLRCVRALRQTQGWRDRKPGVLAATVVVKAAEPLFLEFQAAGVQFQQVLKTEAWGAQTFMLHDPDGNLLGFAGPGEDQAPSPG